VKINVRIVGTVKRNKCENVCFIANEFGMIKGIITKNYFLFNWKILKYQYLTATPNLKPKLILI